MTILSPDFTISGVPVLVSDYVPPGTYVLIDGGAVFHSRAELDETIRRLNFPLCLRLPTRAMAGNARRRALLAKVRERTVVLFVCWICKNRDGVPIRVCRPCESCRRWWLEICNPVLAVTP